MGVPPRASPNLVCGIGSMVRSVACTAQTVTATNVPTLHLRCANTSCKSLTYRQNLDCGYLTAVQVHGRAVQPRRARGDDEGNEVGHVLDGAVSYDAGFAAELGPYFCLRLPPPLPRGPRRHPAPIPALSPRETGNDN